MPKKTQKEEPNKKVSNSIQDEVSELRKKIEELTESKKEDEKIKSLLKEKVSEQEEVTSPQSGPGPECDAFRVHRGEALQLGMSQEPGVYEPVPAGFKVKELDMIPFLIKSEHPDNEPLTEGMVSNCRSKYTEEYEYVLPKRPGDVKMRKEKVNLCRHHARVLLGVSEDKKAKGVNELKDV